MDTNQKTYLFLQDDAKRWGLAAAVVLYNVRYWLDYHQQEGIHEYDGRTWCFVTAEKLAATLGFLSKDQVRRALDKLAKGGALDKGNHNKSSYDRTLWYTLGKAADPIWQNCQMDDAEKANGRGKGAASYINNSNKNGNTPSTKVAGGGGGFGLTGDPGEPKHPKATTAADRDLAKQLLTATKGLPQRKTGIGANTNLTKWATDIKRLRTQDGYSQDQIDATMGWYCANIGGKYTPRAYSGDAFRRKFPQLLVAATDAQAKDVPPSPAALAIAAKHSSSKLGAAADTLPGAVQRVLDTYGRWRSGWCKYLQELEVRDHKLWSKARWLVDSAKLPLRDTYAGRWCKDAVQSALRWEGWRGDWDAWAVVGDCPQQTDKLAVASLAHSLGSAKLAAKVWDQMKQDQQDLNESN